jgi:hypothetical protein
MFLTKRLHGLSILSMCFSFLSLHCGNELEGRQTLSQPANKETIIETGNTPASYQLTCKQICWRQYLDSYRRCPTGDPTNCIKQASEALKFCEYDCDNQ